jgi:short-subunit dehydrogenase
MTIAVALPYFENRVALGNRCGIIYPSSTFDEQLSSPGFALYGATKLGLSQFVQSVKDYTAEFDILDVMLIRMGAIKSNLSKAN